MSLLILIILFSLDSFFVSSIYSVRKIDISLKYILLMTIINVISLLCSFIISEFLKVLLPVFIIKFISFFIMFLLGLYNIFQTSIKEYIGNKYNNKFINIFLDETNADLDKSNSLGFYESILLATILSLDSFVGGISIGSLNINLFLFVLLFFVVNFSFLLLGKILGDKIKKLVNIDFSLLSGIIIIIISIVKFI